MVLSKHKIGDLLGLVDERNVDEIREFVGININKEFIPSVANTDSVQANKYKVLRKGRFVFSGMQTGRDECIRIGLYKSDRPVVVSPAYTTFQITTTKIVLPEYFFMIFLSKEKDRLGWFLSDSSIRSNLDWERFCDIEIELPPIPIQKKYVDIYNAMTSNQSVYSGGLDNLSVACNAFIEKLLVESPKQPIGEYIRSEDEGNSRLFFGIDEVRGIATSKCFIETKANMDGVSLSKYKVVRPQRFAYVADTSRRGDKISLAFNDSKGTYLVSSITTIFHVKEETLLLPSYLFMYFARPEFDRYARFNSWGSARETLAWEDLCRFEIPIPNIEIQQDILNIFNAYNSRKKIADQLTKLINDICPVLIKGSHQEAAHG